MWRYWRRSASLLLSPLAAPSLQFEFTKSSTLYNSSFWYPKDNMLSPMRAITLPGWHRLADLREFGRPFDFTNADIIICSSDGYDFRLHLFILGLSSPIFKNMLAAKAPHNTHPKTDLHIKDGLPVLILTEDSSTLRQ